MADKSILVDQPTGSLASDEGNRFLSRQALYSAEQQADDGQPAKAQDQLALSQAHIASIHDLAMHDEEVGWWQSALGYVAAKGAQDQGALQDDFAARSGNYQQSQALTPDQEAALLHANEVNTAAAKSDHPWITLGTSIVEDDAKAAGNAAADTIKKGWDSAKLPLVIGGTLLVLTLAGVVALKVLA